MLFRSIYSNAPGSMIRSFREKSRDDMGWINGGFMVVEPGALEYIENDTMTWEREPLETGYIH